MDKIQLKGIIVGVAAVVGLASTGASSAFAQVSSSQTFQANLKELNTSRTTGTTNISVNGDQATVRITTTDASANLPHAQHIHIGGTNSCPDTTADTNKSGFISTTEGQPSYGPIEVSLTTTGAVDAASGLAVDRFPVASSDGKVVYERTFTLPEGVTAEEVSKGVIVQHGISELFDDQTKYDGAAKSDLDDSLPFEATAPSACGVLSAVPTGGVATGGGSTAGVENGGLIALGVAGLAAAGALAYRRRGLSSQA